MIVNGKLATVDPVEALGALDAKDLSLSEFTAAPAALTGEKAADLKAKLSGYLEIEIEGIIQRNESRAQYVVQVAGGVSITFPSVREFRSQRVWSDLIYEATRREMPRFKPNDWRAIVTAFGPLIEVERLWSDKDRISSWLESYHHMTSYSVSFSELTSGDIAYLRNSGIIHEDRTRRALLKLSQFRRFVDTMFRENVSERELVHLLRLVHFSPVDNVASRSQDGKRVHSGKIWRGPLPDPTGLNESTRDHLDRVPTQRAEQVR